MAGTTSYRPSNGAEGMSFMAQFCDCCARDAAFQTGTGDSCPIAAATVAFQKNDPEYPPEWIEDDVPYPLPSSPRCTAFEPLDGRQHKEFPNG